MTLMWSARVEMICDFPRRGLVVVEEELPGASAEVYVSFLNWWRVGCKWSGCWVKWQREDEFVDRSISLADDRQLLRT